MPFSKKCPLCSKEFSSLVEYMSHIKQVHEDVPPEQLGKSDNEIKWKLRGD